MKTGLKNTGLQKNAWDQIKYTYLSVLNRDIMDKSELN